MQQQSAVYYLTHPPRFAVAISLSPVFSLYTASKTSLQKCFSQDLQLSRQGLSSKLPPERAKERERELCEKAKKLRETRVRGLELFKKHFSKSSCQKQQQQPRTNNYTCYHYNSRQEERKLSRRWHVRLRTPSVVRTRLLQSQKMPETESWLGTPLIKVCFY